MDDLPQRLQEAEGSGRVEYKRSVLWPLEKDPVKVQGVLMRLANANPEIGGLLHLGREDNGTLVGCVDSTLTPVVDARRLRAAEQKLMQVAQRLDPPMQIRWLEHEANGMTTIVVDVPGRPKGGWYQDENGVTKTGSASHPVIARQALLQAWAREGHVEGKPPYQLGIKAYVHSMVSLSSGGESDSFQVLTVDVLNLGAATSYPDSISFQFDVDGQAEIVGIQNAPTDPVLSQINPALRTALEPGDKQSFSYRLSGIANALKRYVATWLQRPRVTWENVVLTEVIVKDRIGNEYRVSGLEASQAQLRRFLVSDGDE